MQLLAPLLLVLSFTSAFTLPTLSDLSIRSLLLPRYNPPNYASPKRGLIYVPNQKTPQDDKIWVQPGSDLTWYYNYQADPSPAYNTSNIQFVPMCWGLFSDFANNTRKKLAAGTKIPYILSYNEPDQNYTYGGSQATPEDAATHWLTYLEPLRRDYNITLGAPAVSGGEGGWTWLQRFFTACAGRCSASFLPLHNYGTFQGLANQIGRARGTYPNMTIWVTEWATDHIEVGDTQKEFNSSAQYLDRLAYVERQAYFGAFRSGVSNVGPNATMLDDSGRLTDIGGWYLNVTKGK